MKIAAAILAILLLGSVFGATPAQATPCYDCGWWWRVVCVRVGSERICEIEYCEFCIGDVSSGKDYCDQIGCFCFPIGFDCRWVMV